MNSIQHLIRYNVFHLEQGLGLLRRLDEDVFTARNPPVYDSGIGEHLRHIIEHYQCFLFGLPAREIDYDRRRRDARISGDLEFAAATLQRLIDALNEIETGDRDILVKMAGSKRDDEDSPWSRSTIKRELQYLQAHTVHHYALIAMIMKLQGLDPVEDFGVAPSTLRYRRRTTESRN